MEKPSSSGEYLRSPQEELSHVTREVIRRERELTEQGVASDRETVITEKIQEYKKIPSEQILDESFRLPGAQVEAAALNLAPERHDSRVQELIKLVNEKGIKNALSVLEKLGDIHVEDDLHRYLVQYIKSGFEVKGISKRKPLYKALSLALFEIVIPQASNERERTLKEILSGMEQFYAGMLAVSPDKKPAENYLVLEIANENGSEEFVFYAAVPESKKALFEKQILSIFPGAQLRERVNDYNIFNEQGASAGSYAVAQGSPVFPLKTYDEFDHDPLNIVLQVFSKINREGEGASLQLLIQPAGEIYAKRFGYALKKIKEGAPVKEATKISTTFTEEAFGLFKELFSSEKKKKDDGKPKTVDQAAVERVEKKLSAPIVSASLRLAASAASRERAEAILGDLESAFKQFDNPQGLSLRFKRASGSRLKRFLRHFAFRLFLPKEAIPLNLKELTSLVHFHTEALSGVAQLRTLRAHDAPVPVNLPAEGTLLGVNRFQGVERKVYITDDDRLRHFYTIGQTGTGKSTLLKNMIIQDIARGQGVAMIDPHGVDIEDVLRHIPPERVQDLIYFDPAYTQKPMGLNMLEYDPRFPEQKTFVVNELFNIFQKLYGAVPESMGPMFEQYFRNSAMLVIEDPESGSTLLDVSRVLSNREFRQLKLSRCGNPVVVQFWKEVAEKAGGEAALANIVPYITSKFDVFLANDIMRPIVAQEHSAFNFREIMDNRKILLVNLSKGRLGDINANLIGLVLVGKILMAALSRVDSLASPPADGLPTFNLYIDEFQNITTNSIATILSEARKYKLSLTIAHQFIGQLEENIKNAVFGNVGTIAAFRVGSDDAEYLAKQFEPVFTAQGLVNIENRRAHLKLLVNGRPERPFSIETISVAEEGISDPQTIKQASFERFGRPAEEVEAEVMKKYQKSSIPNEEIAPQI
ncbi:hypothetical protein EPN83_02305 [Patescibacteria group bacterium]|nr:MAG: hypothetical protein EPN83_02305 [Patescibacteria group bacterium]